MYIVRGGVYSDTSFTELESPEEKFGPFQSYEQARDKWKAQMSWKIDNCCHRLFIEKV